MRVALRKYPERRTRVFRVHNPKKARNHLNRIQFAQMPANVKSSSRGRGQITRRARTNGSQRVQDSSEWSSLLPRHTKATPSRQTTQAAQIVGNSGSLPTSSVYFQQRSHLSPIALSTERRAVLRSACFAKLHLRDDKKRWKLRPVVNPATTSSPLASSVTAASSDTADYFMLARLVKISARSRISINLSQFQAVRARFGRPSVNSSGDGKVVEMNAGRTVQAKARCIPKPLRSKRQNGRQQPDQRKV